MDEGQVTPAQQTTQLQGLLQPPLTLLHQEQWWGERVS